MKKTKKWISLFTAFLLALNQLGVTPQACGAPVSEVKVPSSGFQLNLPPELGAIQSLHSGTGPTVIHIQTAHGNYEAQKKIQAILHYLKDTYGFKLLLLEGSASKLNPDLLKFFPQRMDLTMKIAEELTRLALVKGDELFLLEEPQAEAYGIEKVEAYRKNREAFKSVLTQKEQTEGFLKEMDRQIERLTGPYLNKGLRSFLKCLDSFETKRLLLLDWLSYLKEESRQQLELDLTDPRNQIDWPMLQRIYKLREFESRLDLNAFANEREAFLKALQRMPKDTFQAIKRLLSSSLSQNQLPDPETGLLFERMVSFFPRNFDFNDYPNVKYFIGHLMLQSELKEERLMAEMNHLTDKISQKLAKTQEETQMLSLLKDYRLLKRLFALELTSEDYEEILKRGGEIQPERVTRRFLKLNGTGRVKNIEFKHPKEINTLFEKALQFYQGTKDRDHGMLENIESRLKETGQDKAIVITGGFHSEPFKQFFESRGYNYALIAPKITSTEGREAYLQAALQNSQAPLKKSTMDLPRRMEPLNVQISLGENLGWIHDRIKVIRRRILKQAKEFVREGPPATSVPRSEVRMGGDILGARKDPTPYPLPQPTEAIPADLLHLQEAEKRLKEYFSALYPYYEQVKRKYFADFMPGAAGIFEMEGEKTFLVEKHYWNYAVGFLPHYVPALLIYLHLVHELTKLALTPSREPLRLDLNRELIAFIAQTVAYHRLASEEKQHLRNVASFLDTQDPELQGRFSPVIAFMDEFDASSIRNKASHEKIIRFLTQYPGFDPTTYDPKKVSDYLSHPVIASMMEWPLDPITQVDFSGNGTLVTPYGLTVHEGVFYISRSGSSRLESDDILRYDLVPKKSLPPINLGVFRGRQYMPDKDSLVIHEGVLYIASFASQEILRYDLIHKQPLTPLTGTTFQTHTGFPSSLALDGGVLYILNYDQGNILRYDLTKDQPLSPLIGMGMDLPEMSARANGGVGVYEGVLYVGDHDKIHQYNLLNKRVLPSLTAADFQGKGKLLLDQGSGLAFHEGILYISARDEILRYDLAKNQALPPLTQANFQGKGTLKDPKGLTVDKSVLYIASEGSDEILRYYLPSSQRMARILAPEPPIEMQPAIKFLEGRRWKVQGGGEYWVTDISLLPSGEYFMINNYLRPHELKSGENAVKAKNPAELLSEFLQLLLEETNNGDLLDEDQRIFDEKLAEFRQRMEQIKQAQATGMPAEFEKLTPPFWAQVHTSPDALMKQSQVGTVTLKKSGEWEIRFTLHHPNDPAQTFDFSIIWSTIKLFTTTGSWAADTWTSQDDPLVALEQDDSTKTFTIVLTDEAARIFHARWEGETTQPFIRLRILSETEWKSQKRSEVRASQLVDLLGAGRKPTPYPIPQPTGEIPADVLKNAEARLKERYPVLYAVYEQIKRKYFADFMQGAAGIYEMEGERVFLLEDRYQNLPQGVSNEARDFFFYLHLVHELTKQVLAQPQETLVPSFGRELLALMAQAHAYYNLTSEERAVLYQGAEILDREESQDPEEYRFTPVLRFMDHWSDFPSFIGHGDIQESIRLASFVDFLNQYPGLDRPLSSEDWKGIERFRHYEVTKLPEVRQALEVIGFKAQYKKPTGSVKLPEDMEGVISFLEGKQWTDQQGTKFNVVITFNPPFGDYSKGVYYLSYFLVTKGQGLAMFGQGVPVETPLELLSKFLDLWRQQTQQELSPQDQRLLEQKIAELRQRMEQGEQAKLKPAGARIIPRSKEEFLQYLKSIKSEKLAVPGWPDDDMKEALEEKGQTLKLAFRGGNERYGLSRIVIEYAADGQTIKDVHIDYFISQIDQFISEAPSNAAWRTDISFSFQGYVKEGLGWLKRPIRIRETVISPDLTKMTVIVPDQDFENGKSIFSNWPVRQAKQVGIDWEIISESQAMERYEEFKDILKFESTVEGMEKIEKNQPRSEVRASQPTVESVAEKLASYYQAKQKLIEAFQTNNAKAYREAFQAMEASAKAMAELAPSTEILEKAFKNVREVKIVKPEIIAEVREILRAAGPKLRQEHQPIVQEIAKEVAYAMTFGSRAEELQKDLIARTREVRLADLLSPDLETRPFTSEAMNQGLDLLTHADSDRFWGLQAPSYQEGEPSQIALRPLEDLIAFRVAYLHEIIHDLSHQGYLPILAHHELITHASTALELVRAQGIEGLQRFGEDLYVRLFERGKELFGQNQSMDDLDKLFAETDQIYNEYLKTKLEVPEEMTGLMRLPTPEEVLQRHLNFERLVGTLLGGYAFGLEEAAQPKPKAGVEKVPVTRRIVTNGLAYLFDYAIDVLGREDLALQSLRLNPEFKKNKTRLRSTLHSFARAILRNVTGRDALKIVEWEKEKRLEEEVPEVRYYPDRFPPELVIPPAVWFLHEDVARGLIAQEIHRANHSQPELIEKDLKEDKTFQELWRVTDTPRVIEEATPEHPGSRKRINRYYDYRHREIPNRAVVQEKIRKWPLHFQYFAGILWLWHKKEIDPRITDPRVREALQQTREALEKAFHESAKHHYEITRDALWPVVKKLREETIREEALDQVMQQMIQKDQLVLDENQKQAASGGHLSFKDLNEEQRKKVDEEFGKRSQGEQQELEKKAQEKVDQMEKSFKEQHGSQGLGGLVVIVVRDQNQSPAPGKPGPQGADQLFPTPSPPSLEPAQVPSTPAPPRDIKEAMEALRKEAEALEKLAAQAQKTAQELRDTAQQFQNLEKILELAQELDRLAQELHQEAQGLHDQAAQFHEQASGAQEGVTQKGLSPGKVGMDQLIQQARELVEKTERLEQGSSNLEKQTGRVVERAQESPQTITPGVTQGLQENTQTLKEQTADLRERAKRLEELTRAVSEALQKAEGKPTEKEELEPIEFQLKEKPSLPSGIGAPGYGKGISQGEEELKRELPKPQERKPEKAAKKDYKAEKGKPVSGKELEKAEEVIRKIPHLEKKKEPLPKEPPVSEEVQRYQTKRELYRSEIDSIGSDIDRHLKKTRRKKKKGGLAEGDFVDSRSLGKIKFKPAPIFGKRSRRGKLDQYIGLLIDISSSMDPAKGQPLETSNKYYASIGGLILREATRDKPGIKSEEYAFGADPAIRLRDYENKLTDELAAEVDGRILRLSQDDTQDVAALTAGIERLKKRRGNRPGLRVFGIFIGTDKESAKKIKEAYAPHGYQVNSASDLPNLMQEILREELGLRGENTVSNIIIVLTDGNPGAQNAGAIQTLARENEEEWSKERGGRSEVRAASDEKPLLFRYVTRKEDGKEVEYLEINGQLIKTGQEGGPMRQDEVLPPEHVELKAEDLVTPLPAGERDDRPADWVAELKITAGNDKPPILVPLSPYNMRVLSEMISILNSSDKPNLYVWGPRGTAKNTLIYLLAALAKRPVYLMSLDFNTSKEELVATQVYKEEGQKGNTHYEPSPMVKAADDKRGAFGILDEVDKPEDQGIQMALATLLDPGRSITLPDTKPYLADKNARFIALGNAGPDQHEPIYEVTPPTEDFKRRFQFLEMIPLYAPKQEDETPDQERQRRGELEFLLRLQAPKLYAAKAVYTYEDKSHKEQEVSGKDFFRQLVLLAQDIYDRYQKKELPRDFGIRALIRTVRRLQMFPNDIYDFMDVFGSSYNLIRLKSNERQKLEEPVEDRLPGLLGGRAPENVLTSRTISDQEGRRYYQILDEKDKVLASLPVDDNPVPAIPVKRHHEHQTVLRQKLTLMKARMLGEDVLIYGHTGTGKTTTSLDFLTNDLNLRPLETQLDIQSTTADLWGSFGVVDNNVVWKKSPTLAAMDDGKEKGQPNVINDIGKVEDQAVNSKINNIVAFRQIMTPFSLIKAQPGFFIIATTTPVEAGYGTHELSAEVEDRFFLAYFDYMPDQEEKVELKRQFPNLAGDLINRFVDAVREVRNKYHKDRLFGRPVTLDDMTSALKRFQETDNTLFKIFLASYGISKKAYRDAIGEIFKKPEYDLFDVRFKDLKQPPTVSEILAAKGAEQLELFSQLVGTFRGAPGKNRFKVTARSAGNLEIQQESDPSRFTIYYPQQIGLARLTDYLRSRPEFSESEKQVLKELFIQITTPPVQPATGDRYFDVALKTLLTTRDQDEIIVSSAIKAIKDWLEIKGWPKEAGPSENLRILLEWIQSFELTPDKVKTIAREVLKRRSEVRTQESPQVTSLIGLAHVLEFSEDGKQLLAKSGGAIVERHALARSEARVSQSTPSDLIKQIITSEVKETFEGPRERILPLRFEDYSTAFLVKVLTQLLHQPVYSEKAGILPPVIESRLSRALGEGRVVPTSRFPSWMQNIASEQGRVLLDSVWLERLTQKSPRALYILLTSLQKFQGAHHHKAQETLIAVVGEKEGLLRQIQEALSRKENGLNEWEEKPAAKNLLIPHLEELIQVIPRQTLQSYIDSHDYGVATLLPAGSEFLAGLPLGAQFILNPGEVPEPDLVALAFVIPALLKAAALVRGIKKNPIEQMRILKPFLQQLLPGASPQGVRGFIIQLALYIQQVLINQHLVQVSA